MSIISNANENYNFLLICLDIEFNLNIITFWLSCCCCWLCCFNCTAAACDFNCPTVALFIQDRLDLAAVETPKVPINTSLNCCTLKIEAPPFSAYEIEAKKATRK